MPLSKDCTLSTCYMCHAQSTHHTSGAHHTHRCVHHTCWWGPQVPHTQCTEHTHAHTHTPTAKGLTTSSAAQLRAPHPARPVLSWGHTDTWTLAGEPNTKSPWLVTLLSPPPEAWTGSSPALLQPAAPLGPLFPPPSHPLPFLEAIPSSQVSSEASRTAGAPGASRTPVGPTAAASPSCCSQGPRLGPPMTAFLRSKRAKNSY